MKKILLLQVVLLLLILTTAAQPKRIGLNNESNQAISLKSAEVLAPFDVATKNARRFELNPAIQKTDGIALGDTLVLALFLGKEYPSVVQSKETDVNGTTIILAKLTGFQFAYCCITLTEKAALVTVDIPERKEKYTTRFQPKKSTPYLVQLDENKLDVLPDGHLSTESNDSLTQSHLPKELQRTIANEKTTSPNKVALKSAQVTPTTDDSAQIDILVVYTPAAKQWADSYEGGINNTISQTMAKCNLVAENNKLGIRFNLVHSTEVDYTETGDSYIDINNLTEGKIPNIYAIRNVVAADLIVLITKTDDVGGISWPLTDKNGSEEYGFLISRVQELSGLITIHEIGHSLGAHHPKDQNFQPGPTAWTNWSENTWSAGWRWKGTDNNNYCDVMSYEDGWYFSDGISHTRVPYFSDPDLSFQSQPTGHATDANNARTIRETKQVVAAYRSGENKNSLRFYTLEVDSINESGAIVGGFIINEGSSPVTSRGIVWSTNRMPTLNDHLIELGSGKGKFEGKITGMDINQVYYLRSFATNSSGTTYGNQVGFMYNAGIERDFITRWQLPSEQETLSMVLARTGNVNYKWETVPFEESGSGTFSKGTGVVTIENIPKGKIIQVSLSANNLNQFISATNGCVIPINPDRESLIDVVQWGSVKWLSMYGAFHNCSKLNITAKDVPDFTHVSSMKWMFRYCSEFTGTENMKEWYTSNVIDMGQMLAYCNSFNLDIGNWDVSKVKDMSGMFMEAKNFNQDIGDWDISSVKNMANMFYKANVFNQDIGKWDVSNVKSMVHMFSEAINFNQDIGKWDVSQVTEMYGMFFKAFVFNQEIGDWDVSNVRNMNLMFDESKVFNGDIGKWDVSKVTDMSSMFFNANSFNQDIGDWDVSSVITMSDMFRFASVFNGNIGRWDVSNVTDMRNMFYVALAFNQDISKWDVSNVEKMSSMFLGANLFNQKISDWNISKVTDMNSMFRYASSFNQNIGNWNISKVTNLEKFFDSSGMDHQNYSATLNGWSTNPNTPDSLTLGADGLKYDCTAVEGRAKLTSAKSWTIVGDQLISDLSQPSQINGETSICQGQIEVTYTVPAIENATSYVWTLPNGAKGTSTTNSIVVDFGEEAVSGNITVKGISACGESTESSLWISINKKPITAGLISGETSVCQGQTAVTYTVPAIENATSYVWTLPKGTKGTSNTNSIIVDFGSEAVSGNITVKGINNCGESIEKLLPVTVIPTPATPTISVTNNVLCSDIADGNQWYCQDGKIENATTKEYVAKAAGNYYVVASNQGCTSAPSKAVTVTLVGRHDLSIDGDLKLYPNPVSNQLTLEVNGNRDNIDFEIINVLGQTIIKGSFVGKTTVETTDFAPGTYLIKTGTGKTLEFSKLVKN